MRGVCLSSLSMAAAVTDRLPKHQLASETWPQFSALRYTRQSRCLSCRVSHVNTVGYGFSERKQESSSEPLESRATGPIWLQGAPEGTSVDRVREGSSVDLNASQLLQLKSAVSQTLSQSALQKHQAQGADDNDESSGYEDAPSEFSPGASTPDTPPDAALLDSDEGGDGSSDSESGLHKSADSCALS